MKKPSEQLQQLIFKIWQKNLRVHDISKDLKKFPEVNKYLNELLQSDSWFTNIRTTLTLCAKGIYEKQYCLNCKKELTAKNVIQGKKYCSCKCNCSSKEKREKTIETNLRKYGVEFPNQNENVKNKRKNTNIKKYGVNSFSQTKEFNDKFKQTCLKKYGVENVFQNEEIKNKANLKRKQVIGYDYTFQRPDIQSTIIVKRQKQAYNNIVNKIQDHVIPLFNENEYHGHQNHESYKWKCKHCGKEFESELYNNQCIFEKIFNSVPICPYCFPFSHARSQIELSLKFFIQTIYQGKIQSNNRTILKNNLELDIYLPELNLAFELDGIYWHDIDKLNKHKNTDPFTYHLMKTEMCEHSNVSLIHIFENEWKYKRESLSWFITEIILSNQFEHIENKNYIIQKITKEEYYNFMEQNSITYKKDIDEAYGIILNNLLVFACGINHISIKQTPFYNINSFSSKINCNLKGTLNIMLNYLKTSFNNISITLNRRFYSKQFILNNNLTIIDTTPSEIQEIQFNNKTYNLYDCGQFTCILNNQG